jgi:hypothetical protein
VAYIYEKSDSGLLVPHLAGGEADISRALREHDPDLRLVPQASASLGVYWSVYRYAGSDRPAEHVCSWVDYQRDTPKPLSHGLVEHVRSLDRNLRGPVVDHDAANARVRREATERAERQAQDMAEDWASLEGRSACLPRSASLRQARSRTGYHEQRGR